MEKNKEPIIAVVQPNSYSGKPEEEYKNLGLSLKYIDEATDQGANIVCLLEGYPGN